MYAISRMRWRVGIAVLLAGGASPVDSFAADSTTKLRSGSAPWIMRQLAKISPKPPLSQGRPDTGRYAMGQQVIFYGPVLKKGSSRGAYIRMLTPEQALRRLYKKRTVMISVVPKVAFWSGSGANASPARRKLTDAPRVRPGNNNPAELDVSSVAELREAFERYGGLFEAPTMIEANPQLLKP